MTEAASQPRSRRSGGFLLDTPISRLGSLYATLVGLVWGSIWSTGPVSRRDGLFVFRGMPKWTFGRGGSCVGACYLTDQNVSSAVQQHLVEKCVNVIRVFWTSGLTFSEQWR